MLYFFNFLLIVLLGLTSCGKTENIDPSEKKEETDTDAIKLFQKGSEGYSCFRIPALIKTKAGTLLAFAEGRKYGCGDEGSIDLIVKRSTDDGKTWGNLIVIWSDQNNTCGNPAPVVDQTTGKIFLLMTWNYGTDDIGMINNDTSTDTRRVFVTSSTDDGLTWRNPDEITTSVKLDSWGWYATGPCHGIQITQGEYEGRLVIPCDNIELKSSGGKGHSHIIYSDDNGLTWQLGGITSKESLSPNESTVAELSDGSIMLNMRCKNNNNFRLVSTSSDGGITWSEPLSDYELKDPVCQGSLLSSTKNGTHTVFFSNAASMSRENMMIKMSIDNGNTWSKYFPVHSGPSAYSDIVMISDEQIGILYEGGELNPYEAIIFEKIDIADFK